jgi:hypothetical protein
MIGGDSVSPPGAAKAGMLRWWKMTVPQGVPELPSRQTKPSSSSGNLRYFHAFVDRLSPSAFVAVLESSLMSITLGLYLSFQEVTEGFRVFLLPSAFWQVIFSLFLIFSRSRRREKLAETHRTLSVSLIAVAVILNLLAVWIVWALETNA